MSLIEQNVVQKLEPCKSGILNFAKQLLSDAAYEMEREINDLKGEVSFRKSRLKAPIPPSESCLSGYSESTKDVLIKIQNNTYQEKLKEHNENIESYELELKMAELKLEKYLALGDKPVWDYIEKRVSDYKRVVKMLEE